MLLFLLIFGNLVMLHKKIFIIFQSKLILNLKKKNFEKINFKNIIF